MKAIQKSEVGRTKEISLGNNFLRLAYLRKGGEKDMEINEAQRQALRELTQRAFGNMRDWERLSTASPSDLLNLASDLGVNPAVTQQAAEFFVLRRDQFLQVLKTIIEDGLKVEYGKAVEIYRKGLSIFDHNEPSHWGMGKK